MPVCFPAVGLLVRFRGVVKRRRTPRSDFKRRRHTRRPLRLLKAAPGANPKAAASGLHPVGCPDQEGYGNCRSCGSRTIHNHLENPAGLRTVPTASTTNQLKKTGEMRRRGHIGYATPIQRTRNVTLRIFGRRAFGLARRYGLPQLATTPRSGRPPGSDYVALPWPRAGPRSPALASRIDACTSLWRL